MGAGQKMTVEKKMNILAGDCGKKKLNNKIDRRWEKQRRPQNKVQIISFEHKKTIYK